MEQESPVQRNREELSGERLKLSIAFHEVGTPQYALYVQILAEHPEGLTVKDTWSEVLNRLDLEDSPADEILGLVGTYDGFKTIVKNQLSHVVSRENQDKGVKLVLNPEYAEVATWVSDLTLAKTEENWIPSEYFYREARTGTQYESTRLLVARYLRQHLLDEHGELRVNNVLRVRDILQVTGTKRNTVGHVLEEFDRLGLCNFVSTEKGDPIVQLSLVKAPEHIESIMNLGNRNSDPYPDLPADMIQIMEQLGSRELSYSQMQPLLIQLYQERYKHSYPKSALYTRTNRFLKQLENEGYVQRTGTRRRTITLVKVPEHIEERVEANLPVLPELPRQIIEFFQQRQSGDIVKYAGYEEINHAIYTTYIKTQNVETALSYPTFSNMVYTALNNLIDHGYIQRQTQRSAITITSKHDRHILLDITEDYNLLLQKNAEFLQQTHLRAQAIVQDPQRLKAVLMDSQGFVAPRRDHLKRVDEQNTEHDKKEQMQDRTEKVMQVGKEITLLPHGPAVDNQRLQSLITQFTESNGSEDKLGAILTEITPLLEYAVTRYEGFGRDKQSLYSDVLYAVNEQLQSVLINETADVQSEFNPFSIATSAIRDAIQEQVAHGAQLHVPESLGEQIRVAYRILRTQSIRMDELIDVLEEESSNEDAVIRKEDIPRILFTFHLKQVAMESSERNLTRVQLSEATRQQLQEWKQALARESVMEILLQGSGNTYGSVRSYLKSLRKPVPANLMQIISEVRQEISDREIIEMDALSEESSNAPMVAEPASFSSAEEIYKRRKEVLLNLTLNGGIMIAKVGRSKGLAFDSIAQVLPGMHAFTKALKENHLSFNTQDPLVFMAVDEHTVIIGVNKTLKFKKLPGGAIRLNVDLPIQKTFILLLSLSLQQARSMQSESAQSRTSSPISDAENLLVEAAQLQATAGRKTQVPETVQLPDVETTTSIPAEKTTFPVVSQSEPKEITVSQEVEVIPETSLDRAQVFLERGGAIIVNEETHDVHIVPYSSRPESEYQQLLSTNPSIRNDTSDTLIRVPLRISDASVEHYISVLEGINYVDFYLREKRPGVLKNWNRMLYVLCEYITDPAFKVSGMSEETLQQIREAAKKAEWTGIEISMGKNNNHKQRWVRSISTPRVPESTEQLLDDVHELDNLQ